MRRAFLFLKKGSQKGMIPCREQLWLFRRIHFHYAEIVGEMGKHYEFAVKNTHKEDDTADRS